MTQDQIPRNRFAPLRNVAAFRAMLDRLQNRTEGVSGMGTFYGPSGYGKTTSVIVAAIKYGTVNIEMRHYWTKRKFCQAILHELRLVPGKTICDMMDQIVEKMLELNVPLVIDEADIMIEKNMIEFARDIYENAKCPVILVGEERMPQKLQAWERIHRRISEPVAAHPADLSDLEHLIPIYAPGVSLADDLKAEIVSKSVGRPSYMTNNLDRVRKLALTLGREEVGLTDWGNRSFFDPQAPLPRRNLP